MTETGAWWIGPDDGPEHLHARQDDPILFAEHLLPMARETLARDGTHASMLFLHLGSGQWDVLLVGFADAEGKSALWREIARRVTEVGYDGLVFIGEVWVHPDIETPQQEKGHDRKDVLLVTAESADGRTRSWAIPFRLEGDVVALDQTRTENLDVGFTADVRRIWQTLG